MKVCTNLNVTGDITSNGMTLSKNHNYENFSDLQERCTKMLLQFDKPEVYDPDITITITTKNVNYTYKGPIDGMCDIENPSLYKISMYVYTDKEYFINDVQLSDDGSFHFSKTNNGSKQFRLIRISDNKWIDTLEYALLTRSYIIPETEDSQVRNTMKDRCYTYDQAAVAIALMVQNHPEMDRYVYGLCQLVEENGGIKFFVNRISAFSNRAYYRMGNAAWVLYGLAFYLWKFPDGVYANLAREKLLLGLEWVSTFKVTTPGDKREGLYMGGKGKFINNGSQFDPNYIASWCAMEHNLDLWFLFDLCSVIGIQNYETIAKELHNNINDKLWIESEGRFRQGVHETTDDNAAALDQSSWGGLYSLYADGNDTKAVKCHKYMERFMFGTMECEGYTPYNKLFGYPNAVQGVWTEGTAGVALFERALGNDRTAAKLIANLKPICDPVYGYRDSCDDPDYDVLPDWPSSCNTAWIILAINPQGFWKVEAPLMDIGLVKY